MSFLSVRNIPARLIVLASLALGATCGHAATKSAAPKDDFMPYVELAPFVVNGKQFAISVHARSKGDRRYAEDFAEEVVKVIAEGVTEDTGKGLVIIGRKGEPHPVIVFRKFLALAQDGKLDPAIAARGPELDGMLHHWQDSIGDGKSEGDVDIEFEKILRALPLPLEGVGAKLYQLAWREGFDDRKVEAKFRALQTVDLEGSAFPHFDWVFYLPARGAFERAIDEVIAEAMKEEDAGFMARMAVKSVMLAVKPAIRKAIEAMRRGLMFSAVVDARTELDPAGVSALTGAYVEALLLPGKDNANKSLPEHVRAVQAVRTEMHELAANPGRPDRDPLESIGEAIERAVDGKAESVAAKFDREAAKHESR
jgi:hypothetical protein